jgi:hypothetical protein
MQGSYHDISLRNTASWLGFGPVIGTIPSTPAFQAPGFKFGVYVYEIGDGRRGITDSGPGVGSTTNYRIIRALEYAIQCSRYVRALL